MSPCLYPATIIITPRAPPKVESWFYCVLSFLFSGDFPRAWSLLLEHIEYSALCPNAEVSLAALKSFQEIMQINKDSKEKGDDLRIRGGSVTPPGEEVMNRSSEDGHDAPNKAVQNDSGKVEYNLTLWSTAWRVWLNIGMLSTKPPEGKSQKPYIPSQAFVTALIQTFPPLFHHIKSRFVAADLQKLSTVLRSALSVPVHGDMSPFIIPTYPDLTITPLQESTLNAVQVLVKVRTLCFLGFF